MDTDTRKIAWGKKVDAGFKSSVLWIEEQLGLNADYLMSCMAFETGQTFSPSIKNKNSSATGLIQFMDATVAAMVLRRPSLRNVAANTHELAELTAQQQLSFVYYYFEAFGRDLSHWSLEDTYMAILLPSMIGKPLSAKMKWSNNAYAVNRGLDINKNGVITKAEATTYVRQLYSIGMSSTWLG